MGILQLSAFLPRLRSQSENSQHEDHAHRYAGHLRHVVAEEETLQAEEQTLISYGAYPHAFRYGYGALPYAGLSYAARAVLPYAAHTAYAYPSTYAVAAAPYNYNFLDTTKEPSAYLPRSYPYVY